MKNVIYLGTNTKIMFDPTIAFLIYKGKEYSVYKLDRYPMKGHVYLISEINKNMNKGSVSVECFNHAIKMGWLVEKRSYTIDNILK